MIRSYMSCTPAPSRQRRNWRPAVQILIAMPSGIRVEVIDDGSTTIPSVSPSQPEQPDIAENGHGLRLVESLSAKWSHYRDAAGTVTWFELTVPSGGRGQFEAGRSDPWPVKPAGGRHDQWAGMSKAFSDRTESQ